MDVIVALHIAGVVGSYGCAALVFTQPVGSKLHRTFGKGYAVAMLTTAFSGLGIYNWGHPSVFHVFSLITIWSIGRGVMGIRKYKTSRDRDDLMNHYFNMAYSFMGLNLAAAAQALRVFSYDSFMQYLTAIGIVYLILIMIANQLIQKVIFRRFSNWFRPKPSASASRHQLEA